jgi:hypothetical protein
MTEEQAISFFSPGGFFWGCTTRLDRNFPTGGGSMDRLTINYHIIHSPREYFVTPERQLFRLGPATVFKLGAPVTEEGLIPVPWFETEPYLRLYDALKGSPQ